MMRIPKATAPGFALLPAAGTIVAAQVSAAVAASAAATPVVNANIAFRPVTRVGSGALCGLSADGTPAARYVGPLHPSGFMQMAPGGSRLPNGESAPADASTASGATAPQWTGNGTTDHPRRPNRG